MTKIRGNKTGEISRMIKAERAGCLTIAERMESSLCFMR